MVNWTNFFKTAMYKLRLEFKTTGVGWAIGMGRVGGILAPLIGGFFISIGLSLSANFFIFSIPALIASVLSYNMSSKEIT